MTQLERDSKLFDREYLKSLTLEIAEYGGVVDIILRWMEKGEW